MDFYYDYNNLPFYDEEAIAFRDFATSFLFRKLQKFLTETNPAWRMHRIEAPCLMPQSLVHSQYTSEDIWVQENFDPNKETLVLKPETTPSSYVWALEQLRHNNIKPPFCVWQLSKSFRREQDQPTKHCRYKEFYQQEFQCLFSEDSAMDYFEHIAPKMAEAFMELLSCPTRLVVCDRTPDYSRKTWDVEVWNDDKWMEVCSMSLRHDFSELERQNKKLKLLNMEIATSPDRLWYCRQKSSLVLKLILENKIDV